MQRNSTWGLVPTTGRNILIDKWEADMAGKAEVKTNIRELKAAIRTEIVRMEDLLYAES